MYVSARSLRAGAAAGRQRRTRSASGRRRVPRSGAGSPDDVVGAVAFLIEADFVTGEQLVVDGGHAL